MDFTGERCVLNESPKALEKEHLDRYEFAKDFVKNKIVLDVASGSGYGTKILSSNAKAVIGVDISKEAVDYANKHYKTKNNSFHVGNAQNLNQFKDNSFDVIVSFETIEHLPDYKKYLSEVHRVLKKNGVYIVSTPNKKFSSPFSKKPKNPFHVIEFRYKEFEKLLKDKFEKVEIYGQDYQTRKKSFDRYIIYLFHKKLHQKLISQKTIEDYHIKRMFGITKDNVNRCKYFIGVCVNE